ncbi:MAG: DMT family transporter [Peptococcaceae bacterium]|jgi:drug/metabolite transporter (DMT)-like permease|nr:DMT family transporter [Peptococcaceae bacterium]
MNKNKATRPIPQLLADLSLLFVAISWGATFVIVKKSIEDLPPFPFLALRFTLAFLILIPLIWIYREHLNKIAIGKALVLGVFLFLGYATQTIGLQYTTASNAGFITGLCIVMVPLLVAGQQKKAPPRSIIFGVICATIGLGLLSLGDNFTINYGDPIMLVCAFCFAIQIYLTGRFAPEVNASILASFQILTVAVLSGICTVIFPQPPLVFSAYAWFGLILTAVICTSLAFLIQSKMQQFTSPSHTAIIFAAEPVFGAVFAYLLASELLSTRGYLGAILVLAGILIAELSSVKKKAY